MTEIIRSLIDWAREQHLNPWAGLWIVIGYGALRLFAMIGGALSKTASGLFEHYTGMFNLLEHQAEKARKEVIATKAELADAKQELDKMHTLVSELRNDIAALWSITADHLSSDKREEAVNAVDSISEVDGE